jgi:hypothetical protein
MLGVMKICQTMDDFKQMPHRAKLLQIALSTLAIFTSPSRPHTPCKRDFETVMIDSKSAILSSDSPLSPGVILTIKGYSLVGAVVTDATMVLGLNLFPISF